jgi:hypothetical protein
LFLLAKRSTLLPQLYLQERLHLAEKLCPEELLHLEERLSLEEKLCPEERLHLCQAAET